jgi:AraC-like DNA-binding protein
MSPPRAIPSNTDMIAERVVMQAGQRLIDHRHNDPHLMVVIAGEVVEDGETYRSGDVRISAAADRHFLRFDGRAQCVVIEGRVPSSASTVRRVVNIPEVALLMSRATASDALVTLAHRQVLLDAIAVEPPAWLAELDDVLRHGRGLHTRRIADVARQAGVSREYLARTYRRYFGTSITAAIKARRLHTAWDALTSTATPLAVIADESGFADQSHLTRHFTDWIGVSPAAARRTAKKVTRLQDGSLAFAVS